MFDSQSNVENCFAVCACKQIISVKYDILLPDSLIGITRPFFSVYHRVVTISGEMVAVVAELTSWDTQGPRLLARNLSGVVIELRVEASGESYT